MIQFSGNLLAVLIDNLIGFPAASGASLACGLFHSRIQSLIFYIFRFRHTKVFYLFRLQIPGDAVLQNRDTIYRYRHLLIRIACPQADRCA